MFHQTETSLARHHRLLAEEVKEVGEEEEEVLEGLTVNGPPTLREEDMQVEEEMRRAAAKGDRKRNPTALLPHHRLLNRPQQNRQELVGPRRPHRFKGQWTLRQVVGLTARQSRRQAVPKGRQMNRT